jgi:thiol-disulfide isomerase/thioredoxin
MRTLFLALAALCAAPALGVAVGDPWQAGAIQHVEKGALEPQQMIGKVTLVNFWATWCEACKVELAEMEKLLAPQLVHKDLNVAFVSLDKERDKAVAWFRQNLANPGAMLPRLYSDAQFKLAERLEVDSFPLTLVIGRDGKVVYVQRGFKEGEGSTEKIVKIVAELLQGRPAG